MTTNPMEKDGRDPTAHIMSLDLPMCDSSVMTGRGHRSQGKKAERTEGVADSSPEMKKHPLPLPPQGRTY